MPLKHPALLLAPLLAILAFCLTGCSSDSYNEDSRGPDPNQSVALFVLHLENRVQPDYQGWGQQISATHTQSGKSTTYRFHAPETQIDNQYVEHFVAIPVQPGQHTITELLGGRDLVFFSYHFQINPEVQFQVPPGSITYVGCLQIINRPPNPGESASGKIFPLIGQNLAGYSGSVIDITFHDRAQKDIPTFQKTYPFLKSRKIDSNLMTKHP
jgi:hypothetical protein